MLEPMNTNCPKCDAKLNIYSRRLMRCSNCGTTLSYNALPTKLLISVAGVALLAVVLAFVTPSTSPIWELQPVLISGLAIIVLAIGLKNWRLYTSRH